MRKEIVQQANGSGFFSILVDGTTDSSSKEQLVLCVRYLDDKNCVNERFLGYEVMHDQTGKAIATVILKSLEGYGVDLSRLSGQGYDGCASMKGDVNGAQAHVLKAVHKKALYTHCASHVFSLVVSYGAKVQEISKCLETIKETVTFITASAKRSECFEHIQDASNAEPTKKLRRLCETRWVERHDAVLRFKELYECIMTCLGEIASWADFEKAAKAEALCAAASKGSFVVAICVIASMGGGWFPKLVWPKHNMINQQVKVGVANNDKRAKCWCGTGKVGVATATPAIRHSPPMIARFAALLLPISKALQSTSLDIVGCS